MTDTNKIKKFFTKNKKKINNWKKKYISNFLIGYLKFPIIKIQFKKAVAKKDNNFYDWLVKLLIIGDSGVGKTNILLRFFEGGWTPSHLTTNR